MNIVYLCLQPLSGAGASDAHVAGIVGGLRAAGHRVDLVASRAGDNPLPGRLAAGLALQLGAAKRMRRADAVYVRMHPLATITMFLVRRPQTLVEVNGVPEDFYAAHPPLRRVARLLEASLRYQLRRADHVITVTDGLAEWTQRFAPRAAPVQVVANAADPETFAPDLRRPADVPARYVLYFGALAPWQGIDLALAATDEAAWPDGVWLVVVGDGQEAQRVIEASTTAPERVVYFGPLPAQDLPGYIAGALATVIPKRYHDTDAGQSPLKLYESLASGVPVIATALRGLSDIADLSEAVTIIDPDPAAFAAAVADIADRPDEAARRGAVGRRAVIERHTWDHRAAQVLQILLSA